MAPTVMALLSKKLRNIAHQLTHSLRHTQESVAFDLPEGYRWRVDGTPPLPDPDLGPELTAAANSNPSPDPDPDPHTIGPTPDPDPAVEQRKPPTIYHVGTHAFDEFLRDLEQV